VGVCWRVQGVFDGVQTAGDKPMQTRTGKSSGSGRALRSPFQGPMAIWESSQGPKVVGTLNPVMKTPPPPRPEGVTSGGVFRGAATEACSERVSEASTHMLPRVTEVALMLRGCAHAQHAHAPASTARTGVCSCASRTCLMRIV
jgi:hypothetical protein